MFLGSNCRVLSNWGNAPWHEYSKKCEGQRYFICEKGKVIWCSSIHSLLGFFISFILYFHSCIRLFIKSFLYSTSLLSSSSSSSSLLLLLLLLVLFVRSYLHYFVAVFIYLFFVWHLLLHCFVFFLYPLSTS